MTKLATLNQDNPDLFNTRNISLGGFVFYRGQTTELSDDDFTSLRLLTTERSGLPYIVEGSFSSGIGRVDLTRGPAGPAGPPGIHWRDDINGAVWDADTLYVPNDAVVHSDKTWRAVRTNQGSEPTPDNADWFALPSGPPGPQGAAGLGGAQGPPGTTDHDMLTNVRAGDSTSTDTAANKHVPNSLINVLDTFVSAKSLGVSPGNTAAQNATALAALSNATKHVVFAPGNYPVDNSAGFVLISNFVGHITFMPGARLVFTDNTKGGIWFNNGNNIHVKGMRVAYATNAPARVQDQHGIFFQNITDLHASNIESAGAPAIGVLLQTCIRPSLEKIYIHETRADGLHFANCQDVKLEGLTTDTTGDDGLAFLNYSIYSDNYGAEASHIVIRNAGYRGISVVGQRDVQVDNFEVDTTTDASMGVAWESTYNGTGSSARVPDNVRFSNGTCKNAGAFSGYGHAASSGVDGISVGNAHATLFTNASFEDIDVVSPLGEGVHVNLPSGGRAAMKNVRVRNATGFGFNHAATKTCFMQACQAETTGDVGFVFTSCGDVTFNQNVARNCSQTAGISRAMLFQNATGSAFTNMYVTGAGNQIIDTQAVPTGYKLVSPTPGSGLDVVGDLGEVRWLTEVALPDYATTLNTSLRLTRKYSGGQSSRQSGNTVPSTGYWRQGDIVEITNPPTVGPWAFVSTGDNAPGGGAWTALAVQPSQSADRSAHDGGGNSPASVTLTTSDANIQRLDSSITQAMDFNLPTTGLYNGLGYWIARRSGATGAFNVTVKISGSTVHTLTAAGQWVYVVSGGSTFSKYGSGAI